METTPEFQCTHLDGTNSIGCHFEGPYKWTPRGMPSCAVTAERNRVPFLQCGPAINLRAEIVSDLSDSVPEDVRIERFERLIVMQSVCSQFLEAYS